jgi:tetratricopeptide (TPR) repeat protein
LYRIGLVMLVAAVAFPARAAEDPDALYANRTDLTSARRAAAIWQGEIDRNPHDFAAAWKRAKAGYWLGGHESTSDAKDAAYEAGMAAARTAIATAPDKPEGHFWLAANMGGYAENHGIRGGLKYRGAIREELEKVLAMDPAFLQGSADRALGRWYFEVPGLFGGSKQKSEDHLRRALAYNPRSIVTRLFLAETLEARDRVADAKSELQQVAALPVDPDWAPEDTEFKAQARAMLARLTGSK